MKQPAIKGITRRDFCGMAVALGAFSLIGTGAAATEAQGAELLRPPGGQDAATMRERCLHCDRCRSICPTGVVDVAFVEDGVVWAGSPTLDFHKGYCDFCGLCQEACPTGALGSFDKSVDKLGVAVVDPDRCLAYFQGCIVCVEACPYAAIECDENGHPVVREAACNGCGLCEYMCPSLVYRAFAGGTRRGIAVQCWGSSAAMQADREWKGEMVP